MKQILIDFISPFPLIPVLVFTGIVLAALLSFACHIRLWRHPLRIISAYFSFQRYCHFMRKERRLIRQADKLMEGDFIHSGNIEASIRKHTKSGEVGFLARSALLILKKKLMTLSSNAPVVANFIQRKLRTS